jgi:hypothetical protein
LPQRLAKIIPETIIANVEPHSRKNRAAGAGVVNVILRGWTTGFERYQERKRSSVGLDIGLRFTTHKF